MKRPRAEIVEKLRMGQAVVDDLPKEVPGLTVGVVLVEVGGVVAIVMPFRFVINCLTWVTRAHNGRFSDTASHRGQQASQHGQFTKKNGRC